MALARRDAALFQVRGPRAAFRQEKRIMKMAVRVSALCMVAVGFALLPTGCGGDSGTTPEGTGGSGSGGKPTTTDTGSGGAAPAGSVPCGENNCTPPEGSTSQACCKEHFTGACGVLVAGSCTDPPKPPPPGCPALPATMGLQITACCTMAGQCGVDLTMFGMGCVDLATAAKQAMMMGVMTGQTLTPASCTP
jgi:hypothetical protein